MTTVVRAVARVLPVPAGAGLARALVERNMLAFRHGWIVLISGIFEPVFYLFSLGVGLGGLIGVIDAGDGRLVEYPVFVAPALMAAAAMNGAIYDATFNIFFKLKYAKLYDSVLATPLGTRDVAVGEISWALLRGLLYSVAFLLVAAATGVVTSWWAVLTIPAATLIGFAFAAVGMAATTFMRSWQDFDYVQLAIMPMFLFSATFYPLSTYPEQWQWVVQATPLYHGVALVRDLMLGQLGFGLLGHVAYLAVMGLLGTVVAARRLQHLLLP
ncbi:MAG: ABC transporter permease [Jiangellaceae bacterium]|nr:ABC transporter permease [Jiangellaceae bacterium]